MARPSSTRTATAPRQVYVDGSRPDLIEAFTRRTFTAMVEAVGDRALADDLATREDWDGGIADLYRTAEPDGAFFYTFTKAVGTRRAVLEGARDAAVPEPSASTDTR